MREQYGGSTKYEDAFTEYVDVNDLYDESTGDVDAPTGWVGRAGRSIVTHDTQGFVTRERCETREAALAMYRELETQYDTWAQDAEAFAEDVPDIVEAVADLWQWSRNYDPGRGPFTLFLDLIGWSEENIGQAMFGNDYSGSLGYLEIHKLSAALEEYSDRPHDVSAWVDELMQREGA